MGCNEGSHGASFRIGPLHVTLRIWMSSLRCCWVVCRQWPCQCRLGVAGWRGSTQRGGGLLTCKQPAQAGQRPPCAAGGLCLPASAAAACPCGHLQAPLPRRRRSHRGLRQPRNLPKTRLGQQQVLQPALHATCTAANRPSSCRTHAARAALQGPAPPPHDASSINHHQSQRNVQVAPLYRCHDHCPGQ